MNIEIMDDFLPSHYNEYYKNLLSNDQSTLSSPFSWYFVDELNEKKYKGNFYFCNEACDIDKNMENAAYEMWLVAQDNIYDQWMFETDPINLQPEIRTINIKILKIWLIFIGIISLAFRNFSK